MTKQQLIILASGCLFVVSLIVILKMRNLKNKIAERDRIITNFVNQERDRYVYAVMKIVVAYFARLFEEADEDAKQALKIIMGKYKNQTLIESDGAIVCPAYLALLDSVATLDPFNFSRIAVFQGFLKSVYACTYPKHGYEKPGKYILQMRTFLLGSKLTNHKEELEKM